MIQVQRYLAIPDEYARWLGGLRWSDNLEAVEYRAQGREVGCTFAMSEEIGLLLEGFRTREELIPFSYVLHFLHELGLGIRYSYTTQIVQSTSLSGEFHSLGRPLRNAGALLAFLTRDLERSNDPPASKLLFEELKRRRRSAFDADRQGDEAERGEIASLEPQAFEKFLTDALRGMPRDQLVHWLKHGCDLREDLPADLVPKLPRSIHEAFDYAAGQPRLASALALVSAIEGMLTLPPRDRQSTIVPTGGYSDLSTRGLPEQIVPSQLVLDSDEFVRRFSQNELLYFQRETPQSPFNLELILLLDQGVRTWGEVRPILVASLMALARRAERAGFSVRIATTGEPLPAWDPLQLDAESLGRKLGASDLTLSPASALRTLLDSLGERQYDVVLLTHPRSLESQDVLASAWVEGKTTRLFAATADDDGRLVLSDLRHGVAIPRSQSRVSPPKLEAPAADPPQPQSGFPEPPARWKGAVEFPDFPFFFQPCFDKVEDHLFDLDVSGDRLMIATASGLIASWSCVGETATAEALPRAIVGDRPLASICRVLGVIGGFVLAGRQGSVSVLVHYDFRSRMCKIHNLGSIDVETAEYSYINELHCAIVRTGSEGVVAIDLAAKALRSTTSPVQPPTHNSTRATQAWNLAIARLQLDQYNAKRSSAGVGDIGSKESDSDFTLELDSSTGSILLGGSSGITRSHVPKAEGRPILIGASVIARKASGGVYGAILGTSHRRILVLFSMRSRNPLATINVERNCEGFALRRNARRVGLRVGKNRVEVYNTWSRNSTFLKTEGSPNPSDLTLNLGSKFLAIRRKNEARLLHWDDGILGVEVIQPNHSIFELRSYSGPPIYAKLGSRNDGLRYDEARFQRGATIATMTALVDAFDHIYLFDSQSRFLCVFLLVDSHVAAWMSNGTRLGPSQVLGGVATPDAAERIGKVLLQASPKEPKGVR
ncbi:hypothetical protein [Singulisphaera sp. PoT]|uniref:hypothetical protein n=1 Tax=Singulisphaera sp. PoT TaxID=3411797 RepID=UPI003BF503D8